MDKQRTLRDADVLAAHLWRIPVEDQPAYKRVIQRLLETITLGLLIGVFFLGCTDPTGLAARRVDGPSLGIYDATRPAPANVSAVLVGTDAVQAVDTISITFTDNAEGEALVSAYFLPTATLAAATQNIGGTAAASGERTVVVVVEAGHTQVEFRNLWSTDLSDPAQNIWGPFSNVANIGGAVTVTVTTSCRAHGKCK